MTTGLGPLRLTVANFDGSEPRPVVPVLSCSIEWKLGEIGTWSATVPVVARNAEFLDSGKYVEIVRAGEGPIFAGFIGSKRVVLENDGPAVEITGFGLARQLSLETTKIRWVVDGQRVDTTVNALLLPGWSATIEGGDQLVYAIFEGATRFEAIAKIAQQKLLHVLPKATEKRLVLFSTIQPSPLRLALYPSVPIERDPHVLLIDGIKITRRDEDVINRIIPLGAGEGVNVLDLRWSDRTSPYTIRSATGPSGQTYYYLQDDASVTAYGLRERVVVFKQVAPIANSPASYREAANTLYELAVAWLVEHKEPRNEWEISVLGPLQLRDPATGDWLLEPGQTVHVFARGVAEDIDGKKTVVDLDRMALVRGIKREFKGDAESVAFELTEDTSPHSGQDVLSEVVDRLWALSVHQRHVTFERQNGPVRRSVSSSYPATITVRYDPEIRFLHRVTLHILCQPLRSNVSLAAAGGGQTTSGGGSHSHSISAFTTQSGGGGTMTSNEVGNLRWAYTQNLQTWTDPGRIEQLVSHGSSAGADYGMFVGRGAETPTNAHLYAMNHYHSVEVPSHQHSVSGQTTTAVTDHTHSVANHTHALVYGIYESTLPSTKQIRVIINGTDRTVALGGPWDNNEINLDITQFLQTQFLTPVQQNNQIQIAVGASGAVFDVEVTVRSIVTMSSVVPL